MVRLIDEYGDGIVDAFAAVEDAEGQVRDRFDGMNVSEDEMKRQVDRLKWDVAADRIDEELELTEN